MTIISAINLYNQEKMGKMKTCKRICKQSYFKEHVRGLAPEQNYPNKATRKLIQKDCIKKICNPKCKKVIGLGRKVRRFHPDYSKEEVEHVKSIGGLSLCHIPNRNFDIMALEKPSKSKSSEKAQVKAMEAGTRKSKKGKKSRKARKSRRKSNRGRR